MQTSIVTENRSEVAWGRQQEGGITQLYKETFEGDEHVHYLNCVDGFPSIYICQNVKLFKFVQFIMSMILQ